MPQLLAELSVELEDFHIILRTPVLSAVPAPFQQSWRDEKKAATKSNDPVKLVQISKPSGSSVKTEKGEKKEREKRKKKKKNEKDRTEENNAGLQRSPLALLMHALLKCLT